MKILKGYLWLLILSAMAYLFIILAMIKGWGLEPKSWFWIILGYFLAHLSWPLIICARQLFLEKVEGKKPE
jgi:hypothetical protein